VTGQPNRTAPTPTGQPDSARCPVAPDASGRHVTPLHPCRPEVTSLQAPPRFHTREIHWRPTTQDRTHQQDRTKRRPEAVKSTPP
jgi:hypothetical protein